MELLMPRDDSMFGVHVVMNASGMKLVSIPAGEFLMGSPEQALCFDEKPLHRVHISRPFLMGQTQVTQAEWELVIGPEWTAPWRDYGVILNHAIDGRDVAVNYASWHDAVRFCDALTERERSRGRLLGSQRYRLPTEAEWEYACRAGTTTSFSFGEGDEKLGEHEWFGRNAYDVGEDNSHRVGFKKPNPWNLFDMHGNVMEWCSDWYASDYYAHSPSRDPAGPADGTDRVLRGGSWYTVSHYCRSASRNGMPPDGGEENGEFGFRVVCDLG
jgi:formylglycine-generating enzyme required for sulfatase activity